MGRGGETKSVTASGVMIELAQCDSHLPGKINKRYREGTEGNHEQDGHPALVLNLEHRACKCDDHKERHRNTSDHGPEDCPVQHHCTPHQTWEVGLEPASSGVVVGDPVEDNRPVNDAIQTGNQDRNEGRQNDEMYLVMRLYWPKTEAPSILPPGIKKVS
jgi:hypothetical protein